jgi:hypothetical protein
MRRSTLLAIACALACALAAGLARAAAAPGLTGESVHGGELTFSNVACSADGTSSFSFTAVGIATGPYPGPFTMKGTAKTGSAGDVLSFDGTFAIGSSVTGSVHHLGGTATMPERGACTSSAIAAESVERYTATIKTAAGTRTERGTSAGLKFNVTAGVPSLEYVFGAAGDSLPDETSGPSSVAQPPKGAAIVGKRLTLPAPLVGSPRVQWQSCRGTRCANIRGATKPSLLLTRSLAGKTVRVVATTELGIELVSKPSARVRARR